MYYRKKITKNLLKRLYKYHYQNQYNIDLDTIIKQYCSYIIREIHMFNNRLIILLKDIEYHYSQQQIVIKNNQINLLFYSFSRQTYHHKD